MLQSGGFICRACRSRLSREWRGIPKYMSSSAAPSAAALKPASRSAAGDVPGNLIGADTSGIRSGSSLPRADYRLDNRGHSSIRPKPPDATATAGQHVLPDSADDPLGAQMSGAWDGEQYTHNSQPRSTPRWNRKEMEGALAEERGFDERNYSPGDEDFWAKFDEIWAGLDPEDDIEPEVLTSRTASMKNRGRGRRQVQRAGKVERDFIPKKEQRSRDQVSWLLTHNSAETHATKKSRFRSWKKNFATAWKRLHAGLPPPERVSVPELKKLLRREDIDAMAEVWKGLSASGDRRIAIWTHVMAEALRSAPGRARLILQATFEEDVAPFYAVEDTMHFLLQQLTRLAPGDQQAAQQDLCDTFLYILRNSPKRYLQLRQTQLAALLKGLDAEKMAELLEALRQYDHPLHKYTQLQFAGRLARDVKYKALSYDILRGLLQKGDVDINTPHFAALCTAILALREGDSADGLHTTPAALFQDLLNLGLRPNLITYTAIIRNLCLNRELDKAREIFGIMLERGIEPDAHLYSVLLNGAKLARDLASVSHFVNVALSRGMRDPVILNDLLQTIFLEYMSEARRQKTKPPRVIPAFRPMLELYAKFFKLEPLQKLVLADLDLGELLLHAESSDAAQDWSRWDSFGKARELVSGVAAWPAEERLDPRGDTLAMMLTGYVRGFSDAYSTLALYARFRNLLGGGDAVATGLVRDCGTLVHDVVIKAVTEWNGMLRVALDVVSDMLRDATASASSHSLVLDRTTVHHHPAPSVHTWSVLLHGLLHHRQHRQAERVLRMMRERGAEPTLVTWNTLVAGYAREQNVAGTVGALQRLERAGLTADDWTLRAFSYLRDKQRALRAMEAVVERRRRRISGGYGGYVGHGHELGAGVGVGIGREEGVMVAVEGVGGEGVKQQLRREMAAEAGAEMETETREEEGLLPLADERALRELEEQVNEMAREVEVEAEREDGGSAQDYDETGWWKE